MSGKYSIDAVLTESDRTVRVWTDNPTFTLGEVTLPSLQEKVASVRQKREQLEALKMQVTSLSNELNEDVVGLARINSRAKSGVRATYGPNSTQYEQIGGVRQSERKKPTRKKGGGNS
ncbi:MAG TPA: hypothetical protein VFA21_06155 [Pyrinomonadaceae bacterium]|nr:hypothetical protein [Pyrinomonadaceae bacterium]